MQTELRNSCCTKGFWRVSMLLLLMLLLLFVCLFVCYYLRGMFLAHAWNTRSVSREKQKILQSGFRTGVIRARYIVVNLALDIRHLRRCWSVKWLQQHCPIPTLTPSGTHRGWRSALLSQPIGATALLSLERHTPFIMDVKPSVCRSFSLALYDWKHTQRPTIFSEFVSDTFFPRWWEAGAAGGGLCETYNIFLNQCACAIVLDVVSDVLGLLLNLSLCITTWNMISDASVYPWKHFGFFSFFSFFFPPSCSKVFALYNKYDTSRNESAYAWIGQCSKCFFGE